MVPVTLLLASVASAEPETSSTSAECKRHCAAAALSQSPMESQSTAKQRCLERCSARESGSATARARRAEAWYGWQTLLVDAGAVSAMVVGLSENSGPLLYGGVGTYPLGAPFVHGAHERSTTGAHSFLMRAGLPLGAAVLGYFLMSGSRLEMAGGAVGGAVLAMGVPITIDATFLAYEEVEDGRVSTGLQVLPRLTLTRNGRGLILSGQFGLPSLELGALRKRARPFMPNMALTDAVIASLSLRWTGPLQTSSALESPSDEGKWLLL